LIISLQDKEIAELSEFEDDYWWNKGRRKILCDLIYEQISNTKNLEILDVGCGSGGTSTAFRQFGNVTGIDFSSLALKFAKNKGLANVVRSTSTSIPFRSEKFDIITVLDVIEHIKDDKSVLKEIWRLLKPNGIIILTVPAFQFLWSEHDVASMHERRYNSANITKILKESQFKIIKLSYFVSFLFPFVAIFRLMTKHRTKNKTTKVNLVKFPHLINKLFEKILLFENRLLKNTNLPFGLSIVCVGKKML